MPTRFRLLLEGEWIAEAKDVHPHGQTVKLPISAFKQGSLVQMNDTLYDLQAGNKISPRAATKIDDSLVEVDLSLVDAWQDVELPYTNLFKEQNHTVVTLKTARRITISYKGKQVAHTNEAVGLFEIGKSQYPLRLYIPNKDVELQDLTASDLTTHCPYKGDASYYAIGKTDEGANLAWYYKIPHAGCRDIKNTICFYTEKPGFNVHIDGGDIKYPAEGFGFTD